MDAIECIMTRRSSGRLVEPAPSAGDLDALLRAAMAGPDHGRLRPWRFVVVRGPGLERLGEVFAKAHAAREPTVPAAELERTRGKPLRAPLIVAAHALGYGCMWRTGWYGEAPEVRDHLGLSDEESVMAWVYLGTEPEGTRPPPRPDTDPAALSTILDD